MNIVYLYPKTSFRTPLRSDSLFGLFMWGFKTLHDDIFEDMLEKFKNGDPPFLLSSAMPFRQTGEKKTLYFPRPAAPPFQSELTEKRMDDFKKFNKIHWLPWETFNRVRRGELSMETFYESGSWRQLQPPAPKLQHVMHNTIDRITNSTGGHGELFYTEEFFSGSNGLFFLLDIRQDEYQHYFEGIFQLYHHIGFGGDASVGKGHFEFHMETFPHDLAIDGAKHLINLSLYLPGERETNVYRSRPKDVWYVLEMRKGKVGGRLFTTGNVWKETVNVFKEGGCFPRIDEQPVYGRFPVVKKRTAEQPFDAYFNGYALMADYKLMEERTWN